MPPPSSPWAVNELDAPLVPQNELGAPLPVQDSPFAPAPPTPGQQQISNDQQQLQKVRWNQANPWGTPENHPGKLGKVAHAFATLGNIAGDIFAPGITANIPGSGLNMEEKEGSLAKRLNSEITDESQNQERGAQAAKTQEETEEAPQKAADAHALVAPNVQHINAETSALLHPQAKTDFEAWQAQNPGKPIADWLEEKASHATDKLDPIKEQAKQEYMRLHPGATLDSFLHDYAVNTQPPQRAPVVNMFVPGANGESTLQTIHAGQSIGPGAQTAAGLNSMNTPTTQQRNVGAQAKLVSEQMPGLISEIQQNAALLGPLSGRWNEFMQGKVGVDNPQMAGLRADLLMMSSAVALMHARGRLPENLREEFDRAINAPKQTPENLIATLNHINKWTTANMHAMGEQVAPASSGSHQIQMGGKTYQYKGSGATDDMSSYTEVKK